MKSYSWQLDIENADSQEYAESAVCLVQNKVRYIMVVMSHGSKQGMYCVLCEEESEVYSRSFGKISTENK